MIVHSRRKLLILVATVAMLASAFTFPVAVSAAGISAINYALDGQKAGQTITGPSTITTFAPANVFTTADTITLTFPAGTTFASGLTESSFSCQQGAGAQNSFLAASLSVSGSGGATPKIAFRCQAASIGAATTTVTIATSVSGAGAITNPTTAGNAYTFGVSITNGNNEVKAGIVVTPAAISPTASTFTASPVVLAANGVAVSTLTATLKDQYGNIITGKNVGIVQSGGTVSSVPASSGGPVNGSGVFQTTNTASGVTGTATYTATDTTDAVQLSATPTVTFQASPSTVACGPAGGSTAGTALSIAAGSLVNCQLSTGTQYVAASLVWTATGFSPSGSANLNQTFTAGNTAGTYSIAATWTDDGVATSATFYYTITNTASTVTCSLPDGSTIAAGSTVSCTFTPGGGYTAGTLSWTAGSFTPTNVAPTNVNPTFTAGSTAGAANITANWQDNGTPMSTDVQLHDQHERRVDLVQPAERQHDCRGQRGELRVHTGFGRLERLRLVGQQLHSGQRRRLHPDVYRRQRQRGRQHRRQLERQLRQPHGELQLHDHEHGLDRDLQPTHGLDDRVRLSGELHVHDR